MSAPAVESGSRSEAVARTRRRTKIIATIGPATRSVEAMAELISAGASVFRLNFSHGSREEHAENVAMARAAARATGTDVAILGDLPGPKLRLGAVADGRVELEQGREVVLTTQPELGTPERLGVSWDGLPAAVRPGAEIYMADGRIRLRALETGVDQVRCAVEVHGAVGSHQGINLPGADVALPAVGGEDLAWVDFAVSEGIDLLAVSFVRSAEDLEPVKERLFCTGSSIPVIAKIEKAEATERAEQIVAAVPGVMIARGDLGIELPIEHLPLLQRRLLALAGRHSVTTITATQMLASMVTSPRPTRAEVSDVASAIVQGTDAVMLSEETAIGDHPTEAVRVMDRIARSTETDLPYREWVLTRTRADNTDIANSVARAAVNSTYTLGLVALVVPTLTGRTAQLVSAHRPGVPVLAVSPRRETVRRMNLLFGVSAAHAPQWTSFRALVNDCARLAREEGLAKSGDLVGITAGLPDLQLGTNLFEVHRVP